MWRIGLASTLLLMAFSALGVVVVAGDAFDDDYDDCPSHTRVDAIENLRVVRGAESDELSVSWDRIDVESLGLSHDRFRFSAQVTVIAKGSGNDAETRRVSLGETATKFDGISQASDWDISVALTEGDYVISHIVTSDFTSGLDKPKLFDVFYYVPDASDLDDDKYLKGSGRELQLKQALADEKIKEHDKGTFYYLGFNHNFDNYYVNTGMTNPVNPKFRIGLVHDLDIDPADADFDHFRLEVRDDSGDNILGFQAVTVSDSIYGDDTVIVFGSVGTGRSARTQYNMASVDAAIYDADERFSNIKTANTIDADEGGRLDAVHASTDANWRQYFAEAGSENDNGPHVFGQAPKMWDGDTTLTMSLPSSTFVQLEVFNSNTNAFENQNRYRFMLDVTAGTEVESKLSYANLMPAYMLGERGAATGLLAAANIPYHQNGGIRRLFARAPDEYYDVSPSALRDDGSYTITVWAENDDDEVISPTATLTFNIQDEKSASALSSNLVCFDSNANTNTNTNLYGPRPLLLPTGVFGLSRNVIVGLISVAAERLCATRITDGVRTQIAGLISNPVPPGLPTVGVDTTSSVRLTYGGRVSGITIEDK